MGRISERLIRQRAEHNEGMVSTLEEVALHQQNIEKIELLGQLCPKLKILYLQNNLIGKIQNLHKLKELEYLNLAVNNVTKLQNLQRCESLKKLDLTINFVAKAGLLSVESLRANIHLEELYLLGNPCSDWPGYRQYVVAKLPQLKKLDGQAIKPSERIAAAQALPDLEAALLGELRAEGVDVQAAGAVEDDSLYDETGAAVQDVPETGYLDDKGELVRPWCPATRLLEHRELEAANREAEDKKRAAAAQPSPLDSGPQKPPRHEAFPDISDTDRIYQKNEGRWDFSLEESPDGNSLVLEVGVGRFLDTSLIQTDLQPTYVRMLVKGKLLQLLLPCEVRPDAARAQRDMTTGQLVITMPKEDPSKPVVDVSKLRPRVPGTSGIATATATTSAPTLASPAAGGGQPTGGGGGGVGAVRVPGISAGRGGGGGAGEFTLKEVRRAAVTAVEGGDEDGDDPPDL
ncbi:hypothetical protein PLESTB_001314000 [Pleodorina starrii]|uniref:Dynein axonemal assembly factor 11-like CS domain-containing protein n=1 Tax=Pleodorina starrii TaxID=330485 RepID=A0A9W6BU80_9CHLO|nr:hypothetical protein PLESTM_001768400 [Pleodorina starrii]GLC58060.1 hypothetical protein PLESTB_001314000 [Pleodorina starrii]GLC66752.1 hypothetical protein PLESTF_000470600 [Pleodorina starrii]